MALEVPLRAEPSQRLTVSLSNQACQIELRQEAFGLFMDLYVNDDAIILGVICENKNRIVRNSYLGFDGDFIFLDTQGTADPEYTGLGSRYLLFYVPPDELPGEA